MIVAVGEVGRGRGGQDGEDSKLELHFEGVWEVGSEEAVVIEVCLVFGLVISKYRGISGLFYTRSDFKFIIDRTALGPSLTHSCLSVKKEGSAMVT